MTRLPPGPSTSEPARKVRPPWRPRFGLGTLLLAMLVVSVMAAAGSYGVRAIAAGSGQSVWLIFLIFTMASAPILVVVISLLYQVFSWLERSKRR